jgi:hypothetical protein
VGDGAVERGGQVFNHSRSASDAGQYRLTVAKAGLDNASKAAWASPDFEVTLRFLEAPHNWGELLQQRRRRRDAVAAQLTDKKAAKNAGCCGSRPASVVTPPKAACCAMPVASPPPQSSPDRAQVYEVTLKKAESGFGVSVNYEVPKWRTRVLACYCFMI